MKTINIITEVKNPAVMQLIKEAKTKKAEIHRMLASGVHPSDIPSELKISFKK